MSDKYGMDRRDFMRLMAGGAAAAGLGSSVMSTVSCTNANAGTKRRVVVLGMDGLDPNIVNMLIRSGRMENFRKLAERGHLGPLGTTMPALSPVAWSSFITGMTPGGHGVGDFLMRDPETHMPVFAIFENRDVNWSLDIGDLQIPVSGGGPVCLRQGKPFWSYLTENGIPSVVIKVPTNFPVDETATKAVSGMGTPGVASTYGMFNYYTTDYFEEYPDLSGGHVHYVDNNNGIVEGNLIGPDNAFFKPKKSNEDPFINKVKVPFKVYVDRQNDVAKIELGDQTAILKKGEFSEWIPVNFDMAPILGGMSGIVRILLKETHPHVKVYITPVHVDPANQALPVTHPKEYGAELAEAVGPFATKMLPADNKAFDQGIFSDEDYVKQAQTILQERLALFDYEWSKFKNGFFFFYISNTDQDAHMLWRNMDESHPMHDRSDKRFSDYLYYLYEEMDRVAGKVLEAADDDTLVLIISDHGFAQFGRQFHLNTWLRRNGYLAIKPEAQNKTKTSVRDIDWKNTVAYGMGFNGLYLNLKGREKHGIVDIEQAEKYVKRITSELEIVRDGETGLAPVHKVYNRDKIYSGPVTDLMPEMLVGYTPGYRSSSDSVLGETGKQLLDLNPWAWSGDHSMAMELVPGTLVSSRKINKSNPNIWDLPVTILDFFGLGKPGQMVGNSIFNA